LLDRDDVNHQRAKKDGMMYLVTKIPLLPVTMFLLNVLPLCRVASDWKQSEDFRRIFFH
jgi:hypothetical protein